MGVHSCAILARFARLRGMSTFFLSGTDEHGQKVERAAREHGITPQEQADATVVRFQEAWQRLHIRHDDFIRTTEARHVRVVESALQALWDKGEIYAGSYEGWYCVPDERYWTAKDVADGLCPDCGRPVAYREELLLQDERHQDGSWHMSRHTRIHSPRSRRNEVLGFLRQPLGDLCISRPAERLSWGIRLPFDPDYVTTSGSTLCSTTSCSPGTSGWPGDFNWGGGFCGRCPIYSLASMRASHWQIS